MMYQFTIAVVQCHRSPKPALRDESEQHPAEGYNLRRTVTTVLEEILSVSITE
jgi:hypothetical protein